MSSKNTKKTQKTVSDFVAEVRRIVVGTVNAPKALKKLCSRLGFSTHDVSRRGHYRLVHPLLGGRSIPFGSSPSDHCWQLAFLQQVRAAIRANPQAATLIGSYKF